MQPPVGPENCVLAISNFLDNGHSKESFDRKVHLDLESRPGPYQVQFSAATTNASGEPIPAASAQKCQGLRVLVAENLRPGQQAVSPLRIPSASPKKAPSNFINCFKSPGRKIHCHSQVYQHGSEHKLNQNLSPGLCEQIRFPAPKSISDPINDWLNLLLCQFPQGKRDS